MEDAAPGSPALDRDARLRGAAALLAVGLAAGGAGEVSLDRLKERFRGAMTRDPLDALATMLLGCSYLFYLAERGENPRCASFLDALLFISTCQSAGHPGAFACTAAGKAIASFATTFGPPLSTTALRAPEGAPAATGADDPTRAIVERLDAILEALRAPR